MTIYDDFNIVQWFNFTPNHEIAFKIKNSRSKEKQTAYMNEFIALDTETSHCINDNGEERGWIYQWAFMLSDDVVYGRKPSELMDSLKKIKDFYKLSEKKKMIVYVHNLPFDWQFLKHFLIDSFGNDYKVLASSSHKIFSFSIGGFDFRCSYKLSNKSLEKWGNDLNIQHKKKVGFIDYSMIKNQNDKLNKKDWLYMFYDVLALKECVEKQLLLYNDDMTTVPLTSTGYIRRTIRQNFKKDKKNYTEFQKTRLSKETYDELLNASMGAICHGNTNYNSMLLCGNIRHRDFRSHYPSQMRTADFPLGKFIKYYTKKSGKDISFEEIKSLQKDNCLLLKIALKNLKIKEGVTMPYISLHKLLKGKIVITEQEEKNEKIKRLRKKRKIKGNHVLKVKKKNKHIFKTEICDNGRVIYAPGMYVMSVTDIDLKWILKQYKGQICILTVWMSKKGSLPSYLQDTVDYYFKGKTELKEKIKKYKKSKEINEDVLLNMELDLMKSKNGLNGIFGCNYTKPVREDIDLSSDLEWIKKATDTQEELDKFYENRNNCVRFQFGVWITANARNELMDFLELIGYDNFIYCDTDSLFYFSTPEIEEKIEKLNKKKNEYAKKISAYISFENKKYYYDVFEDEKEDIRFFKFLHAKCYEYSTSDTTHFKAVIAGVPARDKTRKIKREDELKDMKNLKQGFTFKKCGGTCAEYVELLPTYFKGNEIASACIIHDTTKQMSEIGLDGINYILKSED